MNKFYTLLLPLLLLLTYVKSYALEVDEKLTLRILRVSDSKKTILLNRGIEDGLALNDHAKFYLTSGVVARGVVVKISPSRSIWSLYRVVDGEKIIADTVMNLKIASPIKVTDDQSKVVHSKDANIESVETHGIELAEGANDLEDLTAEEQRDLSVLNSKEILVTLSTKPWEIWASAYMSYMRQDVNGALAGQGNINLSNEGEEENYGYSLGFERYFRDTRPWYGTLSFTPFMQYAKRELTNLFGRNIQQQVLELGLGVNWHFYRSPHELRKLIGFFNFTLGGGRVDEEGLIQSGSETLSLDYDGAIRFYSLGIGFKYYLVERFGMRAIMDYYTRDEDFSADGFASSYDRRTYGSRFYVGLSYRF